jgi:hypothetical protein
LTATTLQRNTISPKWSTSMKNSFGPWATSIQLGSNPQLSAFWKNRIRLLPSAGRASPTISRRSLLRLGAAGALACAVPTLRGKAAGAGDSGETAEDAKLRAAWEKMNDKEIDQVTIRHLGALMFAVHIYGDKHGRAHPFPPAAVPNPALPAEKRLSGLVLLLPHLGVVPEYVAEKDVWQARSGLDEETIKTCRKVFESIDFAKAWDDAVNLKAARTVLPVFLTPRGGQLRDQRGFAVSHFALVRGAKGNDDGAFPDNGGVTVADITDGTVNTLGIGQIHDHFGPWIAAGTSTARHVYHPTEKSPEPTFGSRFGTACYFATCDAAVHFFDMAKVSPEVLTIWRCARMETRPPPKTTAQPASGRRNRNSDTRLENAGSSLLTHAGRGGRASGPVVDWPDPEHVLGSGGARGRNRGSSQPGRITDEKRARPGRRTCRG